MDARVATCFAIAVCSLASAAAAARRDWTGSVACGACHPAELAAWQTTAHARTRARLAGDHAPRCLACHATGEAPAGPAIAVEVGCEACHGAGAAYAEDDLMRNRTVARALGLTDVSTPKARAAVCAPCHRASSGDRAPGPDSLLSSTRGTSFDPMAPVHPTRALRDRP